MGIAQVNWFIISSTICIQYYLHNVSFLQLNVCGTGEEYSPKRGANTINLASTSTPALCRIIFHFSRL